MLSFRFFYGIGGLNIQGRAEDMVTPPRSSPLPRRVFIACVSLTAIGIAIALAVSAITGWLPSRESAGFILPLYFALLLLVLSLAFIVSGNTLMHHHFTGTIQRATDPVSLWCVVGVQLALAAVLAVVALVQWCRLYGSAA